MPASQLPPEQSGGLSGAADSLAAAAMRDTAALWESVCRVSGDFIVIVDRAGSLRFCNRVGDGFTPEHVVGHSILDFTTPESAAELWRVIGEVFATGGEQSLETTVKTLRGDLNYFSLRLGPVSHGGENVAVMICCENILPLKTSEETLRHERHVLRQLLEIQERERQLVSYEIHDGLSQYLAGAMMHLQALEHATGDSALGKVVQQELGESLRLLRAAVDESRRLIGGLRPPALDELGIVEAIESLAAEARAFVPGVHFQHHLGGGRLPSAIETTIFRIVQESLSNARKHAEAKSVEITIEQPDDTHVRIVVRDDGIGFDPQRVPLDRFGLEGIRQRARLFGSEADITSSPGAGTTIRVTLPLSATSS